MEKLLNLHNRVIKWARVSFFKLASSFFLVISATLTWADKKQPIFPGKHLDPSKNDKSIIDIVLGAIQEKGGITLTIIVWFVGISLMIYQVRQGFDTSNQQSNDTSPLITTIIKLVFLFVLCIAINYAIIQFMGWDFS